MFWNKNKINEDARRIKDLETEIDRLNKTINANKDGYAFEKRNAELEYRFALQNKDFELETFKDIELQKKDDQINELRQKVAVLEEKNKMLDRIIDLDADIIDVKDLVTNLIKKLPEINLKSINVTNSK